MVKFYTTMNSGQALQSVLTDHPHRMSPTVSSTAVVYTVPYCSHSLHVVCVCVGGALELPSVVPIPLLSHADPLPPSHSVCVPHVGTDLAQCCDACTCSFHSSHMCYMHVHSSCVQKFQLPRVYIGAPHVCSNNSNVLLPRHPVSRTLCAKFPLHKTIRITYSCI